MRQVLYRPRIPIPIAKIAYFITVIHHCKLPFHECRIGCRIEQRLASTSKDAVGKTLVSYVPQVSGEELL